MRSLKFDFEVRRHISFFTMDKLGVEICKLCIIARIWKPLSQKFSDLCREMGICLQI